MSQNCCNQRLEGADYSLLSRENSRATPCYFQWNSWIFKRSKLKYYSFPKILNCSQKIGKTPENLKKNSVEIIVWA